MSQRWGRWSGVVMTLTLGVLVMQTRCGGTDDPVLQGGVTCEVDTECLGGEVCQAGVCIDVVEDDGGTPACAVDADCAGGQVCSEGACRDATPPVDSRVCSVNSECFGGEFCSEGVCVPIRDNNPGTGNVPPRIDGGEDGGADGGEDGGTDGGEDGGRDGGDDDDDDDDNSGRR